MKYILSYRSFIVCVEVQSVEFLSNKVNAVIIANEPSSKVISNEKGIPKGIQFTAINNKSAAEIVK